MTKSYQGKTVTVVRDARNGDQGFDSTKDQIVIKVDGNERTVLRADVKDVA